MLLSDTEKKDVLAKSEEVDEYAHLGLCSPAFRRFPPHVVGQILIMMGEGKGCKKIADYLATEGIEYSSVTINKWMKEEKEARAALVEVSLNKRELDKLNFTPEALEGLDFIDAQMKVLVAKQNEHLTKKDHSMFLKFSAELREWQKHRDKIVGSIRPTGNDDDLAKLQASALEELSKMASKLLDKAEKQQQKPEDSNVIDVEFVDLGPKAT